jgi:hypothetical protein
MIGEFQQQNNQHSQQIAEIATALSKVQSEIRSIKKDSSGFGYKYTSISELADYLLPILSKNGLAVSQFEDGQGNLVTMLIHTSGQYLKGYMKLIDASSLEMKGVNLAQKIGSVWSYMRRYALAAIVGLTSNDEDTDASSDPSKNGTPRTEAPRTSSFRKKEDLI